MNRSIVPIEILTEIINKYTCLRHICKFRGICKKLKRVVDNIMNKWLECAHIDLDVINKFTGMKLTCIYLSKDELTSLYENVKKLYYNKTSIVVDIFYDHILNLYSANNELDIRQKIFSDCGYNDYYGVDGSNQSVGFLYSATRYANVSTFKEMLMEFKDVSDERGYCDNKEIVYKDLPDDILDQMLKSKKPKESHKILEKYVRNNITRISRNPGDIIDINFLIKIAELNEIGGKDIKNALSEFKDHNLYSTWWRIVDECYEESDAETLSLAHAVDKLFGEKEDGQLLILPKNSSFDRYMKSDMLKRILSSEICCILGVKVYKLN